MNFLSCVFKEEERMKHENIESAHFASYKVEQGKKDKNGPN